MKYKQMEKWLSELESAVKHCIDENNMRRVYYIFSDNRNMMEEYNMDTGVLIRRSWKICKLTEEPYWEVEIGEMDQRDFTDELKISQISKQPFIFHRNTRRNLEWQIRNMFYDFSTYNVKTDEEKQRIIVSTTNKKYYKIIDVPELTRIGLLIDIANLSFKHRHNTLIIQYKKPQEFIDFDKKVSEMIKSLKTET